MEGNREGKMMTPDQVRSVGQVYRQFMASEEKRGWTSIDDYMEYLDFLDDDQLHREAEVLYLKQKDKNPRCESKHDQTTCFIPVVIEAVGAIIELYKQTKDMHKNNKYILQHYLAVAQAGMIITD